MILQCAQCSFRYRVADEKIGPKGRTVRCSHCRHTWFQPPLSKEEALADMERMLQEINAQPKPKPAPLKPGANLPVQRDEVPRALKIGALSMTGLAACLTLFFFVPGLFGFSPSHGIALADVTLAKIDETKENRPVYAISGKIINTADKPLSIPIMRITLVDAQGNKLQPWEDSSAQGRELAPGEEIPFNFDDLALRFSSGTRFVIDLGNSLELALREKPQ